MKIIAFYSIKGGVGKTAACVNVAYAASSEGARTLICDLDPQGSSTYYFKIKPGKKLNSKRFLDEKKRNLKFVKATDYENLDLLPADLTYREFDIRIDGMKKSLKRLSILLKEFKKDYDYVFLDCPPNITLLSENVFEAADVIVVPFIPTTLSHVAYEKLLKFFKQMKYQKKKIKVFFSMVEKRKRLHNNIMNYLSRRKNRFLESAIPYQSDVERMGVKRAPVLFFSPKCKASNAFLNLWNEIKSSL